jgi:hypothetical protein
MEDGPLEGNAQEHAGKAVGQFTGMAEELRVRAELERCNQEQRRIEAEGPGPLWLWALGWADWEAEKELIRREMLASVADAR